MNTQARLRWGILGAARVNERLLPAIVNSANAELVAIASRRPGAAAEMLKKLAPQLTGVQTYDNLEALLDNDDIQAVYVPLANEEHTPWVLRAIERGKHVLCEKPMARNLAEARDMQRIAERVGTVAMVNNQLRFLPVRARIHEQVYQVLTPEQQTKAKELQAEREKRRTERAERMKQRREQRQQQHQQQ